MTEKRFTIIYNEQSKMMQYVDNYKEEPNKWAIWNASETAQELNKLNDENEQLKQQIKDLYKFVKYDVENEIDVYPKNVLEHFINILKIIGDVE